ncbi:MAG: transporter, partial [Chthoniobacterales bacterium]
SYCYISKPELSNRVMRHSITLLCRRFVLGAALFLIPLAESQAQSAIIAPSSSVTPNKSGYTLFQATPQEFMRELSTDRPDNKESPYTVDADHLQLEMDFANFTVTGTDGVRTDVWKVAPVNIKVDLLNQVDLQFIFDGYLHVRTYDEKARPETMTRSGVGDFTTRLKINLWGDDGGATAFALLPFIKFSTNTNGLGNNAVEGGMLFSLALKLPPDFDLGTEVGAGVFRNGEDDRRHGEFIQSVTVGHAIVGKLSGYAELFSNVSTERHAGWSGTVDAGISYLVTDNIQLDTGCNFGVTHAGGRF